MVIQQSLTELRLELIEQALDQACSVEDTRRLESERQQLAGRIATRRLREAARAYADAWGVDASAIEGALFAAVRHLSPTEVPRLCATPRPHPPMMP